MLFPAMIVGLGSPGRFGCFRGPGDFVAAIAAPAAATTAVPAAAALAVFVLVVLFLGLGGFGAKQRLPVGDRDLVVVGMDLTEGEEAVTVPAIFDEGSLE